MTMTWIAVDEEMPRSGREVLVVVRTKIPCVMIAQWAASCTLTPHEDFEGADYDEARDVYFAPEGWYQCYAVNGELSDEPFWRIHDAVTHWMPLPVPA